ncbi:MULTISPECIES: ferredoxin [Streptomyces]|uniref:Ferredoxin n=3 Tax=Streptomyces TaxID=1883 RepID=A0A420UTK7_9ACTN|nr:MULTISPECIES: ferredoxin [Streptomyces]AAD12166.1 ferredoxin [Streptomyces fradiae]AAD41817.1 tylodoxin [Streptomyces fradiae]KNE79463.1 hypothetical protein ADZ36_27355 [Streptomyces fradiae]OFA40109.1 hypothetical protein BEN35_25995 [Streptomyces fradiae]PQM19484.1 ferredoxin [Streptomyces xinghaiensis]
MRVRIDTGRCVGAGQCERAAPTVFRQDEDGVGGVLDRTPPPAVWEEVREAEDLCPARAVLLSGDGTGAGAGAAAPPTGRDA